MTTWKIYPKFLDWKLDEHLHDTHILYKPHLIKQDRSSYTITKIDTHFFKYAQTPLAPVGAIIDNNKINFKLIIKTNF